MKLNTLVLNGLVASVAAAPASNLVTHESRDTAATNFVKGSPVESNTRVPVRIALKQRNLEHAMELLLKVSDPNSPDYGKHYTQDQVVSTFAPEAETVDAVKEWLVASGIRKDSIRHTKNQGWITFETTAGKLESLLNTRFNRYTRNGHVGTYIGAEDYKLPSVVADHIDFITPSVTFTGLGKVQRAALHKRPFWPLPKTRPMAGNSSDCASAITPECLRSMYKFEKGSLSDPSNDLGIFEQAGEQYIQSDLDQFYAKYANYIPHGTAPKNNSINSQTDTQDSGTANFEVGTSSDNQTFEEVMDGFLAAMDSSFCSGNEDCGKYKPVPVISISYGDDEADYSAKFLTRQCNEWMKLGLQGTSVLISSGDSGVASRERPCLGPKKDIYVPGALGGCPYITSVGATQLPAGSKAGDPETATMEKFSSGGGFSNINTTPSYQKDALAKYFSDHDPGYPSYKTANGTIPTSGGIYNRAGRGYPDLSANGLNGVVVVNGQVGTSGGTSQSAPIVAALINRIVNERIKAGKKGPVGFLNPTLYQHPEMFNDVTSGDQHMGGPDGDEQPNACGNKGFSAVSGWDPVTGLGTPNYSEFLKVFQSL